MNGRRFAGCTAYIAVIVAVAMAGWAEERYGDQHRQGNSPVAVLDRTLRTEGPLATLHVISDESVHFPEVRSDLFYSRHKGLATPREMIDLEMRLLLSIPDLRQELRRSDNLGFLRGLRLIVKASQKIGASKGYRNTIVVIALRSAVVQLLMERTVSGQVNSRDISAQVREIGGYVMTPSELKMLLREETGRLPEELVDSTLEGASASFFQIASAYLTPGSRDDENVRGYLVFDCNYDVIHNFNTVDAPALVGAILKAKVNHDILSGLIEIKTRNGEIPRDRQRFVSLAGTMIAAVYEHTENPLSGRPYEPELFWHRSLVIQQDGCDQGVFAEPPR